MKIVLSVACIALSTLVPLPALAQSQPSHAVTELERCRERLGVYQRANTKLADILQRQLQLIETYLDRLRPNRAHPPSPPPPAWREYSSCKAELTDVMDENTRLAAVVQKNDEVIAKLRRRLGNGG